MQYPDKLPYKERIAEFRQLTSNIIELKDMLVKENSQFALLNLIMDHIPVMIYFKDTHNTLLKVNKHFCAIAGVNKEDVENVPPNKIAPCYKELVEHYASNDIDVITTGHPKKGIVETLFNSQTMVRTDKFPVIIDGKVIGVLGISVEITTTN